MFNSNPLYEKEEIKEEIKEHFEEQGFIQLHEFFNEKLQELKTLCLEKTNYHYITKHHSSYLLDDSTHYNLEILMFLEFFKSITFTNFLEEITGFSLIPREVVLKKYTQGNFITQQYSPQEDYIEVIFDLSDEFEQGTIYYMANNEEVIQLEPNYNALTILFKPKEVTHYLNTIKCLKALLRVEMKFEIIIE